MTVATEPTATPGRRRPTAVLAGLLGVTPGEVSTLVVGLAVALVLTIGGLPPVLRHRSSSASTNATAPAPRTSTRPAAADAGDAALAAPVLNPVAGASPVLAGAGSSSTAFDSTPTSEDGPVTPPQGTASVFTGVGAPGAPEGLAVGSDGTVYVGTDNGTSQGEPGPSKVLTFSAAGVAGRTFTLTGQPDAHALGLTGLVLDGHGGLLALDASSARVVRFDLSSGRQSTVATLPNLPACQLVVAAASGCEPGVQDDAPLPRGAALDAAGNLYVTDAAQGAIWQIPTGGNQPVLFLADLAFGSGDGISGIAIAPDGSLVVVAPQAVDPAAAGGGAIYRVAVTDGKAGSKTLLARSAPNESPAGIALLDDGSMVVTLRDAAAVVLLDATGTEVRRVKGDALDAPLGVAFHGNTLLVTNRSKTKANWAVVAVGIR